MSRIPIQRGFVLSQSRAPHARLIQHPSRAFTGSAIQTPKVVRPSFWSALIPKFLRPRPAEYGPDGKKLPRPKKGWNPATYYIVMFLMVGSMSIQMITLKKDYATFTRRTDVRIALLRETVEKLQKGEEVDVERILGTGDPEQEQQWEDVLKEIERDEVVKDYQKKQQEKPPAAEVKVVQSIETKPAPPKPTITTSTDTEGFY